MGHASGFEYEVRSDGSVKVTHFGRKAAILRDARAEEFLEEVASDPQGSMARWTGNYKRGNERVAKKHPRNQR
ncbi:hypothetical protein [Paramicrobacterium fandaimingii]|uniref:hypothetical protein n=1 Tax=Paramicrobacterium fandaimingii TaxID=2708079 RepID=UPI001423FC4D|nr:hypothetical protein [Microbacterium fandaimingii]